MNASQLSRRKFLTLTGVVGGAAMLAACSPPTPAGEQPAASVGEAAGAPDTEPVTIVAKAWPGSPFETESIQAAIDRFREEYPHYTVDWQTEPQAYGQKVLTQIAAGTPPDTMYAGSADFFSWVIQGVLLDITAYVDAHEGFSQPTYWTHYEEELKRCTWEGHWYGLGSCWVCPHLYTNLDAFEAAGIEPPGNHPGEAWTWDEFLAVATALTLDGNGNHPGDSGFDPDDIQQHGVQWPTWFIPLHAAVGSNGGQYTAPAPDGRILFDSPEAMEAIQQVADLVNVHQVAPHGAFFSEIGMNNLEALGSGRLAMIADGSWNVLRIQPLDFNFGTGVLPYMQTPYTDIQAHNQVMAAGGRQPEATWEFVAFLSGDFYQKTMCAGGLWLPTHTSLATPEGIASWLNDDVHPPGYETIALDYVNAYGRTMYMGPGFNEANQIVASALDAVWIGDAQATDVVPGSVQEANQVIEDWKNRS